MAVISFTIDTKSYSSKGAVRSVSAEPKQDPPTDVTYKGVTYNNNALYDVKIEKRTTLNNGASVPPKLTITHSANSDALDIAPGDYTIDTDATTKTITPATAAPASTGAQAPASPNAYDDVQTRTIILGALETFVTRMDDDGGGDFKKDEAWSTEIKVIVQNFRNNADPIVPAGTNNFPSRTPSTQNAGDDGVFIRETQGAYSTLGKAEKQITADTVGGETDKAKKTGLEVAAKAKFETLRVAGAIPIDGIADTVTTAATGNTKFGDFIIAGSEGKLGEGIYAGTPAQKTYNDLTSFFALFDVKSKLDRGGQVPNDIVESRKPKAEEDPGEDEDAAASTGGGGETDDESFGKKALKVLDMGIQKGAEIAGTAAGATVGAWEASEREQVARDAAAQAAADVEEVGAEIAFRYEINGVASGASATLVITSPMSTTPLKVTVPPNFMGMTVPVVIDDANREFFKKNGKELLSVTVIAKPRSGGEKVTSDPEQVRVRKDNPARISFMVDAAGRETGTAGGLQADIGAGGAKDFTAVPRGTCREVYYTKTGGARAADVDVALTAKGKSYKFIFAADPFLVPISIRIPSSLQLQESNRHLAESSAVPHWLFIKSRGAGGVGGGAGDGGPSDDDSYNADTGETRVNIAVQTISAKTNVKWIVVPQAGNPWDINSFEVTFAPGSGKTMRSALESGGLENLGPVLFSDDISKAGIEDQVIEKVREALFVRSTAWQAREGVIWTRHSTVTGPSAFAVTIREETRTGFASGR